MDFQIFVVPIVRFYTKNSPRNSCNRQEHTQLFSEGSLDATQYIVANIVNNFDETLEIYRPPCEVAWPFIHYPKLGNFSSIGCKVVALATLL